MTPCFPRRVNKKMGNFSLQLKILNSDFNTTSSYKITIGAASDNVSLITRNPLIAYTQGWGPNAWGTVISAVYAAIPIETNKTSNIRYVGVNIGYQYPYYGPFPEFVAIYNDNAGIPGTPIATTSQFNAYFNIKTYNNLDGFPVVGVGLPIEAYFGVNGFDTLANTRYWIVVKYSGIPQIQLSGSDAIVPFSERKLSNDGAAWSTWGCTFSVMPHECTAENTFKIFLSN